MTLHEKVLLIYPELSDYNFPQEKTIIFERRIDGSEFISMWEHPTLAQPTQEQLDGVTE